MTYPHDNGHYFAILSLTCQYLEAGYSNEESERLAKLHFSLKESLSLEKDLKEERDGAFR
jgi:hypothetical protein